MVGTGVPAPGDADGVTLTFDDGPDASWTPRILRELADAGAAATFFVIAPRARAHPELVEAILAGGHEVGLHCWEHVRHSRSTRAGVEADTDRALDALAGLGVRPRRWRAPWGDTAPWSAAVAAAHGLSLEGWTADTHDWRGDDAGSMLAATASQLTPAGTVLMHDGIGPGATRGDCLQTVRLIAPLCAEVRRRGWAVAGAPAGAGGLVMRAVEEVAAAAGGVATAVAEVAAGAGARDRAGARASRRRPCGRSSGPACWRRPFRPGSPHCRPPRSGSWCAGCRAPTDRWGGSSTVTSTRSSASRRSRRSHCGARSSPPWARAGCAWGCGVPTRPRERAPRRASCGAAGDRRVEGVKVFCSGAGGVGHALVALRGAALLPVLALVDVTRGVEIDRAWFGGSGMRTSESHRVVFEGAPVLAVLGEPGEITREPWFSRDAIRTAACWAGVADATAEAVLDALAAGEPRRARLRRGGPGARGRRDDRPVALSAGRGRPIRRTTCARPRCTCAPRSRAPAARSTGVGGVAAGARALARGGRPRPLPARPRPLPAPAPPGADGGPRGRGPSWSGAGEATHDHRVLRGALPRRARTPGTCATSAYERDKYDLTIAALGDRPYAAALEAGCSIGTLTERLAERCGTVLAIDGAPTAVERARRRVAGLAHGVTVERRAIPDEHARGAAST